MSTKVLGAHTFSMVPDVNGVPVALQGGDVYLLPRDTPTAPADGVIEYCRNIGGRRLPAFIGPSNAENYFQPAMFNSRILQWVPGTGATLSVAYGDTWTARNNGTSAAQSHPVRSTTNLLTYMRRALFSTGTSATGASGIQSTNFAAFRGNAPGIGGFFFYARFAIETYQAAMRAFVGLSANNAAMAGESSSWANTIGLCKDSNDSTWQITSKNAASNTKYNTGLACAAGEVLDFVMFCKPNDTKVTCRLTNVGTGAVAVNNVDVTANLPVNTVGLYAQVHNMSSTGTTAKGLALAGLYLESDN